MLSLIMLTIMLRQKKTSKVTPFRLDLNLRLILIWPAFFVNILSFEQDDGSPRKCPFPGSFNRMWRAESLKIGLQLRSAEVLAEALGVTVCDFSIPAAHTSPGCRRSTVV